MYSPDPKDLETIQLSDSLMNLSEFLAKNTHEVWAANRIADGWTFGDHRDDLHKKHPCLIPYDDLPDEEKKYDRLTAINTLKLIVSLGYKIEE